MIYKPEAVADLDMGAVVQAALRSTRSNYGEALLRRRGMHVERRLAPSLDGVGMRLKGIPCSLAVTHMTTYPNITHERGLLSSHHKARWATPFLMLSLALLHRDAQSAAMSYSAEGSLTYQVHALPGEAPEPALKETFSVLVDECKWQITMRYEGDRTWDRFVTAFDGNSVVNYGLLREPATGMPSITVDVGPVPRGGELSVAPEYPWLALASSCYFLAATNNSAVALTLAWSPNGLRRRFTVPCNVVRSPLFPYLPTHVQYFQTELYGLTDDGRFFTNALRGPFRGQKYLTGEFKSGGFTNSGGLAIPTWFEYRKYQPRPDPKTTNDLFCALTVSGTISKVQHFSKPPVFDPLPGTRFVVNDLRVPQAGVLHLVTNGIIPSLGGDEMETAVHRAARLIEVSNKRAKRP